MLCEKRDDLVDTRKLPGMLSRNLAGKIPSLVQYWRRYLNSNTSINDKNKRNVSCCAQYNKITTKYLEKTNVSQQENRVNLCNAVIIPSYLPYGSEKLEQKCGYYVKLLGGTANDLKNSLLNKKICVIALKVENILNAREVLKFEIIESRKLLDGF